ncbi:Uma2 family endonuclease [Anaerolineales bacterium HSG25]|nr:Uma2 family endonuclease [Anaerolineales bacterium HSG25]
MTTVTQLSESEIFLIPSKRREAWPEENHKSLPTMYDLPSENKEEEPGLPDEFHNFQANLLSDSYALPNYPREQIFTAGDLNLYFDPDHPKWYRRPDWYAVVGVSRLYQGWDLRTSYVVWDEGVAPYIVMEFLSPSTESSDLGQREVLPGRPPPKWEMYEQILKVPYYILFDKRTSELQVFKLIKNRYKKIRIKGDRLWMPDLEVGIGLWEGVYQGIHRKWLRWYDANGEWLLTRAEQAELRAKKERRAKEQAKLQTEHERRAKEQAEFRAEQAKLQTEHERRAKEQAEFRAEQAKLQTEHERRAKEQAKLQTEHERRAKEQAELRTEQAELHAQQQLINVARNLLSTMDDEAICQVTGLELVVIRELRGL